MEIRELKIEDVPWIAELHMKGINRGFITSLGENFVEALYEAIVAEESSFGFAAEDNGSVIGFVAFSADLQKLYKAAIKKGLRFAVLLLPKMFSLKRLKGVFANVLYPAKNKAKNLPLVELLSVAVEENARNQQLATKLVQAGLAECVHRGIKEVRVIVESSNEMANKLYSKCGFELKHKTSSHGGASNVYVAQVFKSETD